MWVATQHGWYSIVAFRPEVHEEQAEDLLLVRCRTLDDARHAAERCGVEVETTPVADYRYRLVVDRDTWADFLAEEVEEIDYANFKDRIARTQGERRHAAYLKVWSVIRGLQTGSAPTGDDQLRLGDASEVREDLGDGPTDLR